MDSPLEEYNAAIAEDRIISRDDLKPGCLCFWVYNHQPVAVRVALVKEVLEDGEFITDDLVTRGGANDITSTELSCNHYEFAKEAT